MQKTPKQNKGEKNALKGRELGDGSSVLCLQRAALAAKNTLIVFVTAKQKCVKCHHNTDILLAPRLQLALLLAYCPTVM